jgi:Leucine-rich repeat (LRR) protein
MGHCIALKRLRLDYNDLHELPFSFRYLTSLEELYMEHNPMTSPPMEIIYKGPSQVLAYLEARHAASIQQARRRMITHLQTALSLFMSETSRLSIQTPMKNHTLRPEAFFHANTLHMVKGTTLAFYGVVLPYLWSVRLILYRYPSRETRARSWHHTFVS